MSDFDKEAERERLREKYEREEEKREVTEQMSELLLKGATMTNAHCQDCGDPIFRYDGQEFCPTCEKAVQRGDAGDETAEEGGRAGANGDDERIEVATPDEASRVRFGADAAEEAEADEAPTETTEQPDAPEPSAPERSEPRRSPQAPPADSGSPGDIAAAHDALSRTVTQLARQSEAVDDLGRKRDLLQATRAAAEALAAVRESTR